MTEVVGHARSCGRGAKWLHGLRPRRRVALLGGTTTLADCLVGLYYLADLRKLTRGPAIKQYEEAFARQIGVRYAYSFSSGRVALYGLLRALGVGVGDEVLLQVPTHVVVPNAVHYTGAKSVYVDCVLDTYNMDLDQAEQRVSPKTKVLLIQHTFGIPADLDKACAVARRHGLELVEDCVHALGSTYEGRQVGSFGRAAFFSTEETKTISTTMGGVLVTDDPNLAARIQSFQADCSWPPALLTFRYVLKLILYHLLTEPHLHCYTRSIYELFGRRNPLPSPVTDLEMHGDRPANYEQRLSNAQAALGLRQLERLETNLAHRRLIARACHAALVKHGLDTLDLPPKANPALVRYPVWVADPAAAVRVVAPYCVLGTWFSSVLEEATSPAHGRYKAHSCPRAEAASKHLVNIPTHRRVGPRDIETITSLLLNSAVCTRP